jgi:ribose/xylose/arabinose/galactoside ABC-type transport system permease subunit
MSKQYFWPLTMIILGAIMTGTMFGFFPMYLLWFWPVVMLIVGLGALVVADRDEWMVEVPAAPKKTPKQSKGKK